MNPMAVDECNRHERSLELMLNLLSDSGLRQPDEVDQDPETGEVTLLWHEEKVAVVIGDDEDSGVDP